MLSIMWEECKFHSCKNKDCSRPICFTVSYAFLQETLYFIKMSPQIYFPLCPAQSGLPVSLLDHYTFHTRRQFIYTPRSLRCKRQRGSFVGVFSGFLSRQIPCHTPHRCTVSPQCGLSGVFSGSRPLRTSSRMWSS